MMALATASATDQDGTLTLHDAATSHSDIVCRQEKLSAVVISYNRASLIGTCLRALSFADEIIVVDKSSTDGTADIAATIADRVVSVPWSPVVEDTRAFAVSLCTFDWILCLDDDECLSPASGPFILQELRAPRADVFGLPQRHYILGIHDETAYYWPEYQLRLFRRSAVAITPTVHDGLIVADAAIYNIPPETGVCIHHLSHIDAAQWIEKANRYTSVQNRRSADHAGTDLISFAHARIAEWFAKGTSQDRSGYPAAVALLRAIYDIIDRIKIWETEEGIDGAAAFQRICEALDFAYASANQAHSRALEVRPIESLQSASTNEPSDEHPLEATISVLRDTLRHVRSLSERDRRLTQAMLNLERENFARDRNAFDHERQSFDEDRAAFRETRTALERNFNNDKQDLERKLHDLHLTMDAAAAVSQKTAHSHATLQSLLQNEIAARHRFEQKLAAKTIQAEQLAEQLAAFEATTIWRATRPLRRLASVSPRARLLTRRIVKLAWWAVTFQLPQRYRWWRRHQSGDQLAALAVNIEPSLTPQPLPLPLPELATLSVMATDFRITSSDAPVVSIIIPTYGQADLTLRCLKSIAAHPPHVQIEIIVSDDASTDADIMRIGKVGGVRFVCQEANLGFIGNCNAAAGLARGTYLMFLNNDTELIPDCIDSMVNLARATPDCGMVGAMLLFPDGSLQEAGGILWSDASAWNYGRGDNPQKPQYGYVRDVDYCSGACLMIARELFERLGRFDAEFTPAYYEDVDLAFRVREAGLRVLYEPNARVIHYEGQSHGTDLTVGVKSYQLINQQKIMERWGRYLTSEHYPNGAHVMRARDRAYRRRVVLFIDHYAPEPDRDAGSRVVIGFISAMIAEGMVVKFWPANLAYHPNYSMALQRMGVETLPRPGDDFAEWMRENGSDLDTIIVSRPDVADGHFDVIQRYSNCPVIYYGVDLHASRMRMQAETTDDFQLFQAADAMERLERDIWRKSDVVLYLSQEEIDTVMTWEPSVRAVWVTPYGFCQFPELSPPPASQLVLFVAGFGHPPNTDAAQWLVNEIVPLILQAAPHTKFALVGSNPTPDVLALARPGIEVTGYVSDERLQEYYRAARVSIVPLRFGAGVKSKVVEPLREGVPLVTTPTGLQGLPGAELVTKWGTSPGELAAHVIALLEDDDAWSTQSKAQLAYARANFSADAVRQGVVAAIQEADLVFRRRRQQIRNDLPQSFILPLFTAPPASFSVIQMTQDNGGAAMTKLRDEHPRIASLVDTLFAQRCAEGSAFGHTFQQQIIEHGTFEIPSITDDGIYRASVSVLLNDKTVFYGFDRNPNLLLAALFLAEGYPICGVVIPSLRIMINLADPVWGLRVDHLRSLLRLCAAYHIGASEHVPTAPPVIVTGDPSFAHHSWNQLSAISHLAAGHAGQITLQAIATHEPLGPIKALFPEATGWTVSYCPDTMLEQRNTTDHLFVIPGGFRISHALKRRLLELATERLSEDASQILAQITKHPRLVFWFSIRTRNRTAINQIEALVTLSNRVLESFPNVCIVLDGHSLPADFDQNPSYHKSANLDIVSADRAVAGQVIDQLSAMGSITSTQSVIPAIGLSILDTLVIAKHAHVYFCHHGTVQHKIGWFSDAIGIVHSNLRTLQLHPAQWVTAQAEGARKPTYIGEHLIEDDALSDDLSDIEQALRTECYRFVDLQALGDLVVTAGNATRDEAGHCVVS